MTDLLPLPACIRRWAMRLLWAACEMWGEDE